MKKFAFIASVLYNLWVLFSISLVIYSGQPLPNSALVGLIFGIIGIAAAVGGLIGKKWAKIASIIAVSTVALIQALFGVPLPAVIGALVVVLLLFT